MHCPACGSGHVTLSPQTGALCLTCNCNFDPKHGRSPQAPPLREQASAATLLSSR